MTSAMLKWCTSDSIHPNASRFLIYFLLPVFISIVFVSLFSDFMPTLFGAYADQRFFLLGLLLASIAIALVWTPSASEGQKILPPNWPALLVSAAFLLLTIPYASRDYAWVESGMYSLYFFAFAVVGWRISEQGCAHLASRLLAVVVAIACFFYAAMTITVYLFAVTDEFSTLTDIIPWGFVNMRYWSHMATWFLPLLPLTLMGEGLSKKRLWRLGAFFAAGIWWWMVFMTTARGSMLSLALSGLVVFFLYGRSVLPWLIISLRFMIFGILVWILLSVAIPSIVFETLTVRSLHAGSSGRMPLWLEAWHMSLQNFPFGMGPQSWITHNILTDGLRANSRLGHPHNMYLMWAAEYGWLLVGSILVLVGRALRNILLHATQIRSNAHGHPNALIALTASLVAGLVHAGISAVFMVPASMLVGFVVLSVFWALCLQAPTRVEDMPRPKNKHGPYPDVIRVVLAFAIAIGGTLWLQQVGAYHRAMVADLQHYEERPYAPYWPRFWFHGNFPRPEG